jgi:hypothetical protein
LRWSGRTPTRSPWLDLRSITISAVPEPATPAMLLLGAVAMLGWTRRQR